MSSVKLMPGTEFPSINLETIDGETINLGSTIDGKRKLIVIYRGHFCPFCQASLKDLNENLKRLSDADIEVIAVSADGIAASQTLSETLGGLKFTIATGLTVPHMRELGLYISNPTAYIEQTFSFAEPAFFLLNQDGTIRYVSVANNPIAGRVNVDALLMAVAYVNERSATDAAFTKVVWGSVL
eukprot:gene19832-22542_t